jgi:hypothetical protein
MPKGKHALLLRFSKTNQYGEGTWMLISETLYHLIARWLEYQKHHAPAPQCLVRGEH